MHILEAPPSRADEPVDAAFADVPAQARSHFRLLFYAAVYRVIDYARRLGELRNESLDVLFERYPFLSMYFSELLAYMPREITWGEAPAWWSREIERWEHGAAGDLPLRRLLEASRLPGYSRTAFMLAGLVEEDSRFGTVFADLQAPLAHRRPSLELIGRVLVDEAPGLDPWSICRPLLGAGYVEVVNREAPRSEWVLRVPDVLWDAGRGELEPGDHAWFTFHDAQLLPAPGALVLPPAVLERLAQVPALVASGKASAVILRGTPGSERLTVLGTVARGLGRHVVAVQGGEALEGSLRLLGPLCTLTGAMPVVRFDLALGETADVPVLTGYAGPVGFVLGHEGGLRGEGAEQAVSLTLPPLKPEERLRQWTAALDGHPVENLGEINERFCLPGGYIRQVAQGAVALATLDGAPHVRMQDVREACRTLNRQVLDALAEPMEGDGTWDYLVVPEPTRFKLRELERRCRYRERLLQHLGRAFGTRTGRGVRALFSGPSGTGKTLAARILSAELGVDLYRVDLAAVINKYIGETEKNLHRVLTAAEELDVILLLDEGDALLGSRTDVKSANDRYANLETNYLLQRLEHYQGIVIVTTNLGKNIDAAFQRRMDFAVEFLPPQAEERLRIWQLHLPDGHSVASDFLERIAVRCTLTGGQIRNAALHATLMALDGGRGTVAQEHLEEAVRSEYRKAGATCPIDEPGRSAPPQQGMDAFLRWLS